MKYKQLTSQQRYTIQNGLKQGLTKKMIAALIEVNESTLYREINRNGGAKVYNAEKAQREADRRKTRLQKPRRFTHALKREVISLLQKKWSPEQICGYIKRQGRECVSHETIYAFIRTDRKCGGMLWKLCRHAMKKRRKTDKGKRIPIKDRVSIDLRPEEADGTRFGDWEMDTIVGKDGKGALVTLYERRTGYGMVKRLPDGKEAKGVEEAVYRMLIPYKKQVLTITTDNGTEFARHSQLAKKLSTKIFFAHPYSSWEKGGVENYNKLVRQYIPKGTDLEQYTDKYLMEVQKQINSRPRKKLNFNNPKNEFFKFLD